jgi:hypothetical protein
MWQQGPEYVDQIYVEYRLRIDWIVISNVVLTKIGRRRSVDESPMRPKAYQLTRSISSSRYVLQVIDKKDRASLSVAT